MNIPEENSTLDNFVYNDLLAKINSFDGTAEFATKTVGLAYPEFFFLTAHISEMVGVKREVHKLKLVENYSDFHFVSDRFLGLTSPS